MENDYQELFKQYRNLNQEYENFKYNAIQAI